MPVSWYALSWDDMICLCVCDCMLVCECFFFFFVGKTSLWVFSLGVQLILLHFNSTNLLHSSVSYQYLCWTVCFLGLCGSRKFIFFGNKNNVSSSKGNRTNENKIFTHGKQGPNFDVVHKLCTHIYPAATEKTTPQSLHWPSVKTSRRLKMTSADL